MLLDSNLLEYLMSVCYNKAQVDEKLASVGFKPTIVDSLPVTGQKNIMYLVPKTQGSGASNIYEEYVWIPDQNKFEKVGDTAVDLSNYYNKTETNNLLSTKGAKADVDKNTNDITFLNGRVYDMGVDLTTMETLVDSKADKTAATSTSNGLMSNTDKSKLDSVSANANKTLYSQLLGSGTKIGSITVDGVVSDIYAPTPSATVTVDSTLSSTSTNPVQNKIITNALNEKAGTSTATTSTNGLMSSTDKSKLDGIRTSYAPHPDSVYSLSMYKYPSHDPNASWDSNSKITLFTIPFTYLGNVRLQIATDTQTTMGASDGVVKARGGYFAPGGYNYQTGYGNYRTWSEIDMGEDLTAVRFINNIIGFVDAFYFTTVEQGNVIDVTSSDLNGKINRQRFDWNNSSRPDTSCYRQEYYRYSSILLGIGSRVTSDDRGPWNLIYTDNTLDPSSTGLSKNYLKKWTLQN